MLTVYKSFVFNIYFDPPPVVVGSTYETPIMTTSSFGGTVLNQYPNFVSPDYAITPFISSVSSTGLVEFGFPE